jgi:oligoribonuclease NrnB/cAMP/cGMP phosphodiesterase (DHH superfamily)
MTLADDISRLADLGVAEKATHIISHANCPDGTAAALILRDLFGYASDDHVAVRVSMIQYGSAEHLALEPAPGQIFCDFSPHRSRVRDFADAPDIFVLDHHREAKDIVQAFGERGVFADEDVDVGVSGASLAAMLHEKCSIAGRGTRHHERVQEFAHLISVRDTWQRKDPRWEDACELSSVVGHLGWEQLSKDALVPLLRDQSVSWDDLGQMNRARSESRVTRAIEKGIRRKSWKGTRVFMVRGKGLSSDVAEALGENDDLVVGFDYEGEGNAPKLIMSMRSHTDFDVGAFAKWMGGGGHRKAAAAHVPEDEGRSPYAQVMEKLNVYEASK